ncbi:MULTISPECIES: ComF family protein [unclassified Rathayibacter]|uniref:ComF family protein n=1 Tax=unclassified Rathayibacter TaxID=2609250 RepID=UPI001889FEA9|nr:MULTISPECIES: ComF family protein [unclassified Rathayibacter]MBF4463371.1 ComF family protein [Rathayibacter sp. VKM Ac-2879]MBF4504906.1 ComF family protein [Rathayibacter sp. VKM Ac-2878]
MLRDHLLDALAVLLPLDCPACGGETTRAPCGPCSAELAHQAVLGHRVLGPPDDPLEVVTGAAYTGVVRRLVLALKEEARTSAVPALAGVLRPALLAGLAPRDARAPATLVVPPGSFLRRLRRGFDPVPLLVRAAGARASSPARRRRLVFDQVGLGRLERSGNVDGAFRVRRPLDGEVVLVDDVVTSGATLLELRRAVRAGGGGVRGAVVLAGTPLRHADRSADRPSRSPASSR